MTFIRFLTYISFLLIFTTLRSRSSAEEIKSLKDIFNRKLQSDENSSKIFLKAQANKVTGIDIKTPKLEDPKITIIAPSDDENKKEASINLVTPETKDERERGQSIIKPQETLEATDSPTKKPVTSTKPTPVPSSSPTKKSTANPSSAPTKKTAKQTKAPTSNPTPIPTSEPTTKQPVTSNTQKRTNSPVSNVTSSPSSQKTQSPVQESNKSLSSSECLTRINFLRSKFNVEPIKEITELQTCVNRQSEFDKQTRGHASYKRCGATGSQGQGIGSSCTAVIDGFYHERWSCHDTAIFAEAIGAELTNLSFKQCRTACMNSADCRSFDFLDGVCRFFPEGSHTHVHVQKLGESYWLGAPELTNVNPKGVDTWESYSSIDVDGINAVPGKGIIDKIKWYGSSASGITFYIYRQMSAESIFQVIGMATASKSVKNKENTLAFNPPVQVEQGDVIGWTYIGSAAFGYDESTIGQMRYKNQEKSGGPNKTGDEWEFDEGPLGRQYHYAASFIPDDDLSLKKTTSVRNYCAAGICQYHCGPVMNGARTRTFAWGVWNNFYTFNWRPNVKIPAGGTDCPSQIDAVRCHTTADGILWVYGVSGEDCHSLCSLAGATSFDYKCDAATVVNGFQQESDIMTHFQNPHNPSDTNEFTCQSSQRCWDGVSPDQILIMESNSDCYYPMNKKQYSCTARSVKCRVQFLNQVCPCTPGCSWAAGPNCKDS